MHAIQLPSLRSISTEYEQVIHRLAGEVVPALYDVYTGITTTINRVVQWKPGFKVVLEVTFITICFY